MGIRRLRTGAAGALILLSLLGGPAALASAADSTAPRSPAVAQDILPCAVLEELESTLRELAETSDPGALKDRLDVAIESLEEIRGGVPVLLRPAYDGLVAQFKNLRAELEKNPTAEVVKQINGVARQAADLVAVVPCV